MSDGCTVCESAPGERIQVTISGLGEQLEVEMCNRCFEKFPEDETVDMTNNGGKQIETASYRITEAQQSQDTAETTPGTLVEQAPDATFIADPDTATLCAVNKQAAELTGYTQAELEGMSVFDLHPPTEDDRYAELFGTEFSDGSRDQFADGMPLYLRCADGTNCPIEMNVSIVDTADGELVQGIIRDITDRKERERDLRMKSQALEESPVGITIADANQPDEPIIYANEGFSNLTGYPRERVLDNNCRFLQGEGTDDATVAEIRAAIESERSLRTEILNYRVDGTPFWNKLTLSPVTGKNDEDVTHFVGIQEDVTSKKRSDRLIEVLNRVLRHNLRNDINAIQGFAGVIEDRTDSETAQMAQKISEKAGELISLSEQARNFQTTMRDADPLAPRDVVADIEAVVMELQAEFPEAEFTIEAEKCKDVMATESLCLALRELGANAAQHSGSSAIIYNVEMTDEDQIAISVQDSGPGLPKMEREVLEVGRETALEHGSGLGLWLVNWIITELGGEVTATVNDGTTVMIELSPASVGAVPEHQTSVLSNQSR